MLLSVFIRESVHLLETLYPSPEARGIVLNLCREKLGVENYTHIINPSYAVSPEREAELMGDMERLKQGEPIQYVLGRAEFCGRTFKVDSCVLIPRPETEQLVGEAVAAAGSFGRNPRVLDLCTGSGCIAWSIKLELPDSCVVAADVSREALEVASGQPFSPSPSFVEMDILDTGHSFDCGRFDVIVCNPPYIMEKEKAGMRINVLGYEPGIALFVPDDDPLLFYRAVTAWAKRLLVPGGVVLVEINELFPEECRALFEGAGFGKVEILSDFLRKPRFLKAM